MAPGRALCAIFLWLTLGRRYAAWPFFATLALLRWRRAPLRAGGPIDASVPRPARSSAKIDRPELLADGRRHLRSRWIGGLAYAHRRASLRFLCGVASLTAAAREIAASWARPNPEDAAPLAGRDRACHRGTCASSGTPDTARRGLRSISLRCYSAARRRSCRFMRAIFSSRSDRLGSCAARRRPAGSLPRFSCSRGMHRRAGSDASLYSPSRSSALHYRLSDSRTTSCSRLSRSSPRAHQTNQHVHSRLLCPARDADSMWDASTPFTCFRGRLERSGASNSALTARIHRYGSLSSFSAASER